MSDQELPPEAAVWVEVEQWLRGIARQYDRLGGGETDPVGLDELGSAMRLTFTRLANEAAKRGIEAGVKAIRSGEVSP